MLIDIKTKDQEMGLSFLKLHISSYYYNSHSIRKTLQVDINRYSRFILGIWWPMTNGRGHHKIRFGGKLDIENGNGSDTHWEKNMRM